MAQPVRWRNRYDGTLAIALPFELTQREVEVLRLLAGGRTCDGEVAKPLGILAATAAVRARSLLAKLGVHSRAAAVATA